MSDPAQGTTTQTTGSTASMDSSGQATPAASQVTVPAQSQTTGPAAQPQPTTPAAQTIPAPAPPEPPPEPVIASQGVQETASQPAPVVSEPLPQMPPTTPDVSSTYSQPASGGDGTNSFQFSPAGADPLIVNTPSGEKRSISPQTMKVVGVSVLALVLLSGAGSVVYMIGQTTRTVTQAQQERVDKIDQLLTDIDTPAASFGLVGRVEAAYENPFDDTVSYDNPFDSYANPFR